MGETDETAVIVGAGIGGLSAAIALRRAGIDASVYERAPALGEVGAGISLWPNATRVLRSWGLLGEVVARGFPFTGGEMRTPDGRLIRRMPLPPSDAPAVLIHRADLHAVLAAALPSWAVNTGAPLRGFRETEGGVVAELDESGTAEGRLLVGADGLRSTVRAQLLGDGEPVYRGYPVWRGVAPAGAATWGALTETMGRGRRFGIVPIGGGRVAWWAAAAEPAGTDDGGPEARRAKLLRLFGGWHAPVPALLDATPADSILKNDTFDRPPARRWGHGRVTLLGDAAHPTTPNLGQGGCMAIVDADALARALAAGGGVPAALRAYEAARRRPTARVVRESLRYGRIAQAGGPAATLRDAAFRAVPGFVVRRALRQMMEA